MQIREDETILWDIFLDDRAILFYLNFLFFYIISWAIFY